MEALAKGWFLAGAMGNRSFLFTLPAFNVSLNDSTVDVDVDVDVNDHNTILLSLCTCLRVSPRLYCLQFEFVHFANSMVGHASS